MTNNGYNMIVPKKIKNKKEKKKGEGGELYINK